jgi:hypothetical protein
MSNVNVQPGTRTGTASRGTMPRCDWNVSELMFDPYAKYHTLPLDDAALPCWLFLCAFSAWVGLFMVWDEFLVPF